MLRVQRADVERQLRRFGSQNGVRVSILRAPGIYARLAALGLPADQAERLALATVEGAGALASASPFLAGAAG